MNWWVWIVGGAILLGSELGLINTEFYLLFVGGSALLTGVVALVYPDFPAWAQWALFAVTCVVSTLGFRRHLYERLYRHSPKVATGPEGKELLLPSPLAPGGTCQAEHGGSFWTVRNDSSAPLAAGCKVRIARVQGLTLLVRPE
ncbi:MAG TPA: NfeD family protein [Steroidobacteraceae bacterium]|jgi:membrane protein implicated in regulation of membrane protease activity|nr:NfeD family protein [Steroidobacteraceae bacterium]